MAEILNTYLNNAYAVLLVVFGLGFLVFIHELGHFLVAKWAGVKVEMFSIGFGPTLASWRKGFGLRLGSSVKDYGAKLRESESDLDASKYGETEYSIRALPLGGFVLMLGEEGEDGSGKTSDPRAFSNKPVEARMAIISAGVVMNILFGFACATWVHISGKTEIPAVIGAVVAGQPAYDAGIRSGDEVVMLDGRGDIGFRDLSQAAQISAAGQKLRLDLKRPGHEGLIHVEAEPRRSGQAQSPTIGISWSRSLALDPKTPEGLVSDDKTTDRVIAAGPKGASPTPVADAEALKVLLVRHRADPLVVRAERGKAGDDRERASAKTSQVEATVPPRPFLDFGMRMTPGPIIAVRPDSPAGRAGLRKGDRIARVDGDAAFDPMRLPDLAYDRSGRPMTLEVIRDDKPLTLTLTPDDSPIWSEPSIGIEPLEVPGWGLALEVVPKVAAITPGSPAEKAKVAVGDVVRSIAFPKVKPKKPGDEPSWDKPQPLDGQSVAWPSLFEAIQDYDGPVRLDLGGPKKPRFVDLTPEPVPGWFNPSHGMQFADLLRTLPPESLGPALRKGFADTVDLATSIVGIIRNLIRRRLGTSHVGGPIPIARGTFQIAKSGGFGALLPILGMLSVNLAVFNCLPVPPLDGGQMVFLIAEKVRGRPLPENAVLWPKLIGVAFVLILFALVFLKDIIALF